MGQPEADNDRFEWIVEISIFTCMYDMRISGVRLEESDVRP